MVDMRASVRAPEFPAGMGWLNVERPLSLQELRGKIVLLDFWTYCCINCMHIIPELKKLEKQFPDTFVVIGVHSPKYYAEQRLENVRQAVLRYDIEHPVVSDPEHVIWDSYAVNAWPTLALIDPDGSLVGHHPGEFVAEDLARTIDQIAGEFDRQGKLKRSHMHCPLEKEREPRRPLNYPGKVLVDSPSDRIFIADSSHHRIVQMDLKGNVQTVVGTMEPSLRDGDFDSATFNNPQGMVLDGDILYVADTDNHSVRRLDFVTHTVERIAGTGEQARLARREGLALSTALSSPWDVTLGDRVLYIANAGNHQLWALHTDTGELHRFAGTGREALSDGTLERCALAQTSGLSYHDHNLYFADSETSSIRVARTVKDTVETIVGQGLFTFGDRDGVGDEVLLQHPLGVEYHRGKLYIADTYNNKIKIIDPEDRSCRTYIGGEAGFQDGSIDSVRLWEPGGLSICGGLMCIADTNNHAIRLVSLSTGKVRTLEIKGL